MSGPRSAVKPTATPAGEALDAHAIEAEARRLAAWFESLSDEEKAGVDHLAALDRDDAKSSNGSNGG